MTQRGFEQTVCPPAGPVLFPHTIINLQQQSRAPDTAKRPSSSPKEQHRPASFGPTYSRMSAEIEAAGSPPNVENPEVASRCVKVHSRCAKDPQKLKSTLENLYGGGFTIEMRHNMYIINSVELMYQSKIVSVLTWRWDFPRPIFY